MKNRMALFLSLFLLLFCLSASGTADTTGAVDRDTPLPQSDGKTAAESEADESTGAGSLTLPVGSPLAGTFGSALDRLMNGGEVSVPAAAGAVENDCGMYRVIVYGTDGTPVVGAVIQLCDETACTFQQTDESGVAAFSVSEQKVYDVHVLMAPEGFSPDQEVYQTLDTFSDVYIFLVKADP